MASLHTGHGYYRIKPRYLLAASVIFGVVCVVSLRQNNQHMEQLKQAVYSADQSGNGVQQALDNLQAYVTTHMNTGLDAGKGSVYPPIQLEYTYSRLVQAEEQKVQASNAGLYTAAQNYCQAQDPTDFSGRNRVPCIEQYVTSHGVSMPAIPTALYEFDFIAPSWSPDWAGWSLIATLVCLFSAAWMYLVQLLRKLGQ